MTDVLVIGAGPAGMSAAIDLQKFGLTVTVIDDQPAPGGRIFAAIETRMAHDAEERMGHALVGKFRRNGGTFLASTEAWQIEGGQRVFLTHNGRASIHEPRFILFATGAQERPFPFVGWQLPGVMTVGSAQLLLKTARQIPADPVWIAGTGPLLLLYALQLMDAGGTVAGILDTGKSGVTPPSPTNVLAALPYGWKDMLRGLTWLARLRNVPVIRGVSHIEAIGHDQIGEVHYRTAAGLSGTEATRILLTHDGVVPNVHATMSAGCAHHWNASQQCFEPDIDEFGASSIPTIYICGDGATIAGARAAIVSGKRAAAGIALAAGKLDQRRARAILVPLQRRLAASSRFRRFIDTVYPPSEVAIPDQTVICRCEEVTAETARMALRGRPHLGPDGLKIDTRAGMGPCQGRQCGLTLTRLVAQAHGCSPDEIGFLHVRAPLKPLTLDELATLDAAPC